MQYAKDPRVNRSLNHSVRDGMASSAMVGSAETYLSAFAVFFKASAAQVTLLATLPALLGALGQFLAAWLNRNNGRRKPMIVGGALLQAFIWLPLIAMTVLLPSRASVLQLPSYAVPLLMLLVTLYFFCGQFTTPLWTSLMGDLVPERRRGRFFGHRTRLTTIMSFSGLIAGGIVLHVTDTLQHAAWGFVMLFSFAFLARMKSAWHLARMHEPPRQRPTEPMRLDRHYWNEACVTGAPWFSLYVTLMQAAVAISGPLFTVYMLKQLEFSYLQLMMCTGAAILVQFMTLSYWGRIADVFGNRLILSVSSVLVPLVPALWLVSDNFWFLLLTQCLGGLGWGAFMLSSSNLLYELVPSEQRSSYSAVHGVAVALGVFFGGMIGIGLYKLLPAIDTIFSSTGAATPLLSVFLVSALARLLVTVSLLRRVREARSPRRRLSTRAFIFRVTRFDMVLGLAYELACSFRGRPRPDDKVVLDSVEARVEPAAEAPQPLAESAPAPERL